MKKNIFTAALVLLLLFGLAACSSNSIVGKWKDSSGKTITEFTQDGSVMVIIPIEGTYTTKDNQLTTVSGDKKKTYTFVIEGNQLKLTDKDGKVTTYTRD